MRPDQYKNIALQQFIEKLDNECYDEVTDLCNAVKKQAAKLNGLEVRLSASQYVLLCTRLAEETGHYIQYRKETLIPYIKKLNEKSDTGHDCSTCTGAACKLQHDLLLIEIGDSHVQVKETLYRLQMAVLPLYSETIYPDDYRILRNQVALLENSLAQMLFLESTYLVPKIADAQKNINAHH